MNGNGSHLTLEEWLRKAYAPGEGGCPPPEAFLPEELAALDPAARQRIDAHAERCPACSAERELARLFTDGPEAAEVPPEDVRFVVDRLEAASPVGRKGGRVVPFTRAAAPVAPAAAAAAADHRPRRSPWLQLAAAAMVILAAGLFVQRYLLAPPPLPAPPASGVLRGGEVEPLAPVGEVAAAPRELAWEPRPGAAAYHVRLRTVDDELLWEGTVAAPPARLPAAVSGLLRPAVTYAWSVEALDGRGARLAGSEPVRFHLRPAGEGRS